VDVDYDDIAGTMLNLIKHALGLNYENNTKTAPFITDAFVYITNVGNWHILGLNI